MPIRFRCAYCNQLLGISRRKAGTVVRCPTCAGQVIVPNADAVPAPMDQGTADPLVFERNDFSELLNSESAEAVPLDKKEEPVSGSDSPVALPSSQEPPPGAWGTHAEPAFDVERINPVPLATAESIPQAGLFLSTRNAMLVAIGVAILLAIFFVAGLFVGLWLRPAGHESARSASGSDIAQCACGSSALTQAASLGDGGGSGSLW
jgi:DNA-directed RNA polymerase subunit RPC12/RpoP